MEGRKKFIQDYIKLLKEQESKLSILADCTLHRDISELARDGVKLREEIGSFLSNLEAADEG